MDEADAVFPDACLRAGDHLRGGVDGGDRRCIVEQALGPHSGTACKLENVAGRPERL